MSYDPKSKIPQSERIGTIKLSQTGKSLIFTVYPGREAFEKGFVTLKSVDEVRNGVKPYSVVRKVRSSDR